MGAEIDSLEIKVTAELDKTSSSFDKLDSKISKVSGSLSKTCGNSDKLTASLKKSSQSTEQFLSSIKGLGSNRQFFGGKKELEKEITSVKNQIEKAKIEIEKYENAGRGVGVKGWESQQRQLESLTNYLDNLIKKKDSLSQTSGRKIDWAQVEKNHAQSQKAKSNQTFVNPTEEFSRKMSDAEAKNFASAALKWQESWDNSIKNISSQIDSFSTKANSTKQSSKMVDFSNRLDFNPTKLGQGQSYTKEYIALEKEIDKAEQKLEKLLNTQERLDQSGVKQGTQRYKNVELSIDEADKKLQMLYADMQKLQSSGGDVKAPTQFENLANSASQTQTILQSVAKALRGGGFSESASFVQKLSSNMGSLSSGLQGVSEGAAGAAGALQGIGIAVPTIGIVIGSIAMIGTVTMKVSKTVITTFKKIGNTIKNVATKIADIGKSIIGIGTGSRTASTWLGKMWNKITGIIKTRILRQAISKALSYAKQGIDDLAKYSDRIGTPFNKNISNIVSNFKYLGRVIATAFEPLINIAAPIIDFIINKIVTLINMFNQFFNAVSGSDTWTKATYKAENYAESLDSASGSAKDLNKQLREFDKLNVITDPNKGKGSGGGSGKADNSDAFETLKVDTGVKNLWSRIKDAWMTNADFTWLGEDIAKKLSEQLDKIDWSKIQTNAKKLGKGIATLINGFVEFPTMATDIGNAISESINTAIGFVNTFVKSLHWDSVGKFIGTGIETAIEGIDWDSLIDLSGTLGQGLANAVNSLVNTGVLQSISKGLANLFTSAIDFCWNFVSTADFNGWGKAIGDSINTFVEKLGEYGEDGMTSSGKAGGTISKLANGFLILISNAVSEVNWNSIGSQILSFLGNIDWLQLFLNATTLIIRLKSAFGSLLIQAFLELPVTLAADIAKSIENLVTNSINIMKTSVFEKLFDKFNEAKNKTIDIIVKLLDGSDSNSVITWFLNKIKSASNITQKVYANLKNSENSNSIIYWFVSKIQGAKDITKKIAAKLSNDKGSSALIAWLLEKIKAGTSLAKTVSVTVKTTGEKVLQNIKTIWDKLVSKKVSLDLNFSAMVTDLKSWLNTNVIDKINNVFKNVPLLKNHLIPRFANGGFPTKGQLFIANEAGPELVASGPGGRSEVLNQSQIARAMFDSVANANAETNALLRKQNSILVGILEKETGISSNDIFNSVRQENSNFKSINGYSAFA